LIGIVPALAQNAKACPEHSPTDGATTVLEQERKTGA
jgi:hypothetical protein